MNIGEALKKAPEIHRVSLVKVWEKALPRDYSKLQIAKDQVSRALSRSKREPLPSMLSLITVFVSLFLFGTFLLSFSGLSAFLGSATLSPTASVYFTDSISKKDLELIVEKINASTLATSTKRVSKSEAFNEFKTLFGSSTGDVMKEKLPASLDISIKDSSIDKFEIFSRELAKLDGVESLRWDKEVLKEASSIKALMLSLGGLLISLVFILTVGLILLCIRLSFHSFRDEIETMVILGATNPYIRAPYLFEGVAIGVIGGLVASISVLFVVSELADRVKSLGFDPSLSTNTSIFLLLGLPLVGGLISFIATFVSYKLFVRKALGAHS